MFSCMCEFVFVKDDSNSVLLLTLKFPSMLSVGLTPRNFMGVFSLYLKI